MCIRDSFVIAIENSGTKVLPHIFNAVILSTIISAGNSDVYISSRVLYSMGLNGLAPKYLTWTTKSGIPYAAVLTTSLVGFLAYLESSHGASVVFDWLLNITAVAGFFAWMLISVAHIRFMQALKHQGISRDDLPFKAKFMPWGAYYAAFFIGVIIIIQGFTAFAPKFNVSDFFTAYVSVILFFAVWIGFQIWFRGPLFKKTEDIDLDTDRREIDNDVWEEDEPKNLWEKFWSAVA